MLTKTSRFVTFVNQHSPSDPLLPGVRTISVARLGKIVDSLAFPVDHEDLLYFFYGKPSFKISKELSAATKILSDASVCFVVDLESFPGCHRVFALDTGGYHGERYESYLPEGMALTDFELPPDLGNVQRLVSAFFGDNRNYYRGDAKEGLKVPALDSASEAYANMIRAVFSEDFDERACTCEIQYDKAVPLAASRIVTIIMPGQVYDEPEVRRFVDDQLRVKPILYQFKRAKPEERTEVIYEKLHEYYQASRFFER